MVEESRSIGTFEKEFQEEIEAKTISGPWAVQL